MSISFKFNKNKYQKGFTLIELLLVVGIVTLLSSVLFYSTSEAKKQAEDSHMESESDQLEIAVNMFRDEKGFVPHNLTSGGSAGRIYLETEPEYEAILSSLVSQKFISEVPHSPDKKSYAYGFSPDLQKSVFIAKLKSKKSSANNNRSNLNSTSCSIFASNTNQNGTPDPSYYEQLPDDLYPGGQNSFCVGQEKYVNVQYGVAYCLSCPAGTLYDPINKICDWSENFELETEPSLVCDGSVESEYCVCI